MPEAFSSGCTTLDNALGGGWMVGRLLNVFGLEGVGKTLIMIEAAAQFAKKYPKAPMRLVDAEAAFDPDYAQSIGFPTKNIIIADLATIQTVEDWYDDLVKFVESVPKGQPALYMLDSLDALSSDAEMARDIRSTGYKTEKSQALSQLFRRCLALLSGHKVTLFVISQMRMNPAAKAGMSPFIETGGMAFRFYASQRLKIKKTGTISKTRNNEKRDVGVDLEAEVKKNRLGPNFRKAQFPLIFSYGIDNFLSNINWLSEHTEKIKSTDEKGKTTSTEVPFLISRVPGADKYKTIEGFKSYLMKLKPDEFKAMRDLVNETVVKCNEEIEENFRPAKSRDEGVSEIEEIIMGDTDE